MKKTVVTDEERFTKFAGKNWLDPYVHTVRNQVDQDTKEKGT